MNEFFALVSEPFRLGAHHQTMMSLLGKGVLERLVQKHEDINSAQLYISLRELIRYLYLSAYSPRAVFFPGDKLMDELWHDLIIETACYRDLCEKLRPGTFIDHSGIRFSDYILGSTSVAILEEQRSWLASYVHNFGPIEKDSFSALMLAQSLANEDGLSLEDLNNLGKLLLDIGSIIGDNSFSIKEYLQKLSADSNFVDSDPMLLKAYLQTLLRELDKSTERFSGLISNENLEDLFGASTALSFVLWQHLAVIERLSANLQWQQSNPELWDNLKSGKVLCGLATTHLARPGGASLRAVINEDGFVLTGIAPWVCGDKIFDFILIGFEAQDSIIFTIGPFPTDGYKESVSINPVKMLCLNGTSTVGIEFKDYFIPERSIVSQRMKNEMVPHPRKSIYCIPEIGIGIKALNLAEGEINRKSHPKNKFIGEAINSLRLRLQELIEMRSQNAEIDILIPLRDNFNRDAIRLYALSLGASSMAKGSLVGRWTLEMIFLDALIQSPKTIEQKIVGIGG